MVGGVVMGGSGREWIVRYEFIKCELEGHVALVTLNRPDRLNALTHEMMYECAALWPELEADGDVRAVVVTGAGEGFCSGADVKAAQEKHLRGEFFMNISDTGFHGWSPRRYKFTKPVIAAVNGMCCGGGLDFVTEADIVLAGQSAVFFDSHVSIGLASGHEAVLLLQRLNMGEAMMMQLLGRHYRMSAERACELGLVQRVYSDDELVSRALEMAAQIASNAPIAVRATKEGMWRSLGLSLDDALQLAASFLWMNSWSDDVREGIAAIAEGREPNFTGNTAIPFRSTTP